MDVLDNKKCTYQIKNGAILRIIVTMIVFYIISKNKGNLFFAKYVYLILPILLIVLDKCDDTITIPLNDTKCAKTFGYQSLDKIVDCFSYLLLLSVLDYDPLLIFFIFYRIIGVLLFLLTRKSYPLIIFFDFVKEYLLYRYIFGTNYSYICLFILFKIIFEFYFHTFYNKSSY